MPAWALESGAAAEIRVFNPPPAARPALPCRAPAPPAAATAGAARRAREGGRGAECGNCDARRPRGLRPPETHHRDSGCRALQALRTRDCLPAPSDTPAKQDGGRKEENRPPLATAVLNGRAAPALAPTRPSPLLGSKPENKTHVWEGGASAAGRTGSAGLQAAEMLRHGANMDAGLLSFFSLEKQASPGARKADLRVQKPH